MGIPFANQVGWLPGGRTGTYEDAVAFNIERNTLFARGMAWSAPRAVDSWHADGFPGFDGNLSNRIPTNIQYQDAVTVYNMSKVGQPYDNQSLNSPAGQTFLAGLYRNARSFWESVAQTSLVTGQKW